MVVLLEAMHSYGLYTQECQGEDSCQADGDHDAFDEKFDEWVYGQMERGYTTDERGYDKVVKIYHSCCNGPKWRSKISHYLRDSMKDCSRIVSAASHISY